MERSRRADAVVFGFDFQVNAAIVLFLENIEDVEKICLEGNYEDIELELSSGKMILAQAKAVEKASSDFVNVRKNLKKALTSLSEAGERVDAKELIEILIHPIPSMMISLEMFFTGMHIGIIIHYRHRLRR